MSPVPAASDVEPSPGFAALLARYLSFIWLFEAEPLRADLFTRSRIIRSNHDRGLRYLPLYLARICACCSASRWSVPHPRR